MPDLTIIGRAERIDIPEYGAFNVPAKVDTGADSSAVWASDVKVDAGTLRFKLFGPTSTFYTGEEIRVPANQFRVTRIANSFGHKEMRYAIKIGLIVQGRHIKATITLANRSNKTYPILLGRKLLAKKFLVDVSVGNPLASTEVRKKQELVEELSKLNNRSEL